MMTFKPILMLTPLALATVSLLSTVIATTPAYAEFPTAKTQTTKTQTTKTQTAITQYSRQTLTQTGVGKVQINQNQQIDIITPQPIVGLDLPRGGMDTTIMRSNQRHHDRAAQRRNARRQQILEQRSIAEMPIQNLIYPYYPR
jgi:hypothetical protein